MKGFRPGKEPAHIKKQRAVASVGKDASWAQKQTIEAVAGRSPEQVRAMVRRWSVGLFVGGCLLALLGAFLYGSVVWAGVVVHLIAGVVWFLAYRIRKQGAGLADIAASLQ